MVSRWLKWLSGLLATDRLVSRHIQVPASPPDQRHTSPAALHHRPLPTSALVKATDYEAERMGITASLAGRFGGCQERVDSIRRVRTLPKQLDRLVVVTG